MNENIKNEIAGSVKVRSATKDDMKAVAEMIKELAAFQNMASGPQIGEEDLVRDGFASPSAAFQCKVAELQTENNPMVGYAVYVPTYSTWRGRSMLLEDIYVKPKYRHRGIGNTLFNAVAKEALNSGSARLEFHVLDWNDARFFYQKKGAIDLTTNEHWRYYRLEGDALYAASVGSDQSSSSIAKCL